MVPAALVQGNHVASQRSLFERFFLDFCHDRPTGQERFLSFHIALDGGVHSVRDVLNAHQDVQLQVQALFLFGRRPRVEPVPKIIVLLIAELLQRIGADMVVREDQAVGRDERPGAAAVETHRGFLKMFQPAIRWLEIVFFFQQLAGRIVIEPHALVRDCRYAAYHHRQCHYQQSHYYLHSRTLSL